MDHETSSLIQEILTLFVDVQIEVRALRDIIVDRKFADDAEIRMRMDDIRREQHVELKAEVLRRSFEKALKDRPMQ